MSKLKAVPRGKRAAKKEGEAGWYDQKASAPCGRHVQEGSTKLTCQGTRRKRVYLTIYKRLLKEWNLNKTPIVSSWILFSPQDLASSCA